MQKNKEKIITQKFSLEKKEIEVNLEEQKITKGDNQPIEFEVEPFRKECLINGYDDIALTLKKQIS
jgi:3-isopropylmalate/(R)-2-methylmalate dehydratase small subunit